MKTNIRSLVIYTLLFTLLLSGTVTALSHWKIIDHQAIITSNDLPDVWVLS